MSRLLLSSSDAIKSPSAHPERSCSCCFCSFRVFQSWSYSQNPALAQGSAKHWIQSYFHCISSSSLLHVVRSRLSQSSLVDPRDHPHWSLLSNYQLIPCSLKVTKRCFRHAAPHSWNTLPRRVPYQSDPSSSLSSSLSSCCDPRPLVDVYHGVFHSRLKTFFSKSFPPYLSIPSSGLPPGILPLVVLTVTGGVILASAANQASPGGFRLRITIYLLTYLCDEQTACCVKLKTNIPNRLSRILLMKISSRRKLTYR